MQVNQGKINRLIFTTFFLLIVFLYIGIDLQKFLSFEYIKSSKTTFISFYENSPNLFLFIYFFTYLICTSFSLPGATFLTLAAGAIFGIMMGTIVVSFASSFGATIAMLMSRYLIKDWVQKKFSKEMETINHHINKDGVYYLFSLRLLPLIPFFVVNLVMGLTSIRIKTFYWVSQLGMLPATLLYVNAGLQLKKINSFSDIYSPIFMISFLLLAIIPILVKKLLSIFKNKQF